MLDRFYKYYVFYNYLDDSILIAYFGRNQTVLKWAEDDGIIIHGWKTPDNCIELGELR